MQSNPLIRVGECSPIYHLARLIAVNALCLSIVIVLLCPPAYAATFFNTELIAQTGKVSWGIWGWSDGTVEYALICTRNSLRVVDVSDPANPNEIADVPSVGTDLRIVRTYGNYAYAINQVGPIQIIDLSDPFNIQTVATFESPTIPGAHTIQISGNYAYLSLWGVGAEDFRILDLTDPLVPVEVGSYRHPLQAPLAATEDVLGNLIYGSSLCHIRDCTKGCMGMDLIANKTSGIQLGPFPVMAHDSFVRDDIAYIAYGGGGFAIVDVTDPANPVELSVVDYDTPGSHSTWLSEDGSTLYVTDEYPGGHINIWDVGDLTNPTLVGEWKSNSERIIHNIYVDGDNMFIAYYTDGFRIVDISTPTEPIEVGYYDHHPGPEGPYYEGAFGAYPYTLSGKVLVSDMKKGLHIFDVDRNIRGGYVEGTITDFWDGSPLENVTIEFVEYGKTEETDANGFFRTGLPEGLHTIQVSHYGHRPATLVVTVTRDQTLVRNKDLIPATFGKLEVFVRGSESGSGLDRAAIEIKELPGEVRYADSQGLVDWGWIPTGTYDATIARWGYQPSHLQLQVDNLPPELNIVKNVILDIGFFDDSTWDQGWILGVSGDDATEGDWVRADPNPSWSIFEGPTAPDWDADVTPFGFAYHTGYQFPDQIQYFFDVDGGKTTLMSPRFNLQAIPDPLLTYFRWFSNDTYTNAGEDPFVAEISNDDGQTWVVMEESFASAREWIRFDHNLNDFVAPTDEMRIRFVASDYGGDSVVEAAVDRLSIAGELVDVPNGPRAARLELLPPYPNPSYGKQTTIRFSLPSAVADCRIVLLDVKGRQIRTLSEGPRPAGLHVVPLANRSGDEVIRSGLYWVRMRADGEERIQKLVLLTP